MDPPHSSTLPAFGILVGNPTGGCSTIVIIGGTRIGGTRGGFVSSVGVEVGSAVTGVTITITGGISLPIGGTCSVGVRVSVSPGVIFDRLS